MRSAAAPALVVAGPDGGGGPLGGLDPEDPRVQKAMDRWHSSTSTLTRAE